MKPIPHSGCPKKSRAVYPRKFPKEDYRGLELAPEKATPAFKALTFYRKLG